MGSILSRMRVAATLRWAASMALKLRVHAKDLRSATESEARSQAAITCSNPAAVQQAVQLCIRPKEEIQLCFLKASTHSGSPPPRFAKSYRGLKASRTRRAKVEPSPAVSAPCAAPAPQQLRQSTNHRCSNRNQRHRAGVGIGAAAIIIVRGDEAQIARPLHRHGNLARPISALSAHAQTVPCVFSHPAVARQQFVNPLDDRGSRRTSRGRRDVDRNRRQFLKFDGAESFAHGLARRAARNTKQRKTRVLHAQCQVRACG